MKRSPLLFVTAIMVGFSLACSTTPSSELATDEMYADVYLYDDGNLAAFAFTALTEDLARVEFEGGDTLTLTVGEDVQELSGTDVDSSDDDSYLYVRSYETQPADTAYHVALTREVGESAPQSGGTTPPAPEPVLPAAGDSFGPTDTIDITWQPGTDGDAFKILLVGDGCVAQTEWEADDSLGSLTVDPATLTPESKTPNEPCGATLYYQRIRSGSVDPAFMAGSARAVQSRAVDIELTFQ